MTSPKTILITGANRGIGYSIVQATAQRYPSYTYFLACRSLSSGQAAVTSLHALGITSKLDVLELDVTSNSSILAAAEYIKTTYGHLDILVNNAGIAYTHKDDLNDLRESYNNILNTNVTSITALTSALLPLLHASPSASQKVINISSGRASLQNSVNGNLPSTSVIAYSVSKVALNALTIEMQKGEKGAVEYFAVNPGHCKTEFNGFRGEKDPLDGAE
ncbi:Short-chain dehydrogenase/reductase tropE, partial [Lachnellula suecica]